MIEVEQDGPPVIVPRAALVVAACVMVLTGVFAWTASRTDVGAFRQAPPNGEPLAERSIVFGEEDDGALVIRDADSGETVQRIAPGAGGFVRGVLRPLARERSRRDIDVLDPYRLARWEGGRVTLSDPGTGLLLELHAFGRTSVGDFAELVPLP